MENNFFLLHLSYPSFQIPSIRSKMRSYGHIIMAQDKGIRFPPKHHDPAALIHSCVTILVSSSSYYLWYIWSSKTISICFQIRYMMHIFSSQIKEMLIFHFKFFILCLTELVVRQYLSFAHFVFLYPTPHFLVINVYIKIYFLCQLKYLKVEILKINKIKFITLAEVACTLILTHMSVYTTFFSGVDR